MPITNKRLNKIPDYSSDGPCAICGKITSDNFFYYSTSYVCNKCWEVYTRVKIPAYLPTHTGQGAEYALRKAREILGCKNQSKL